MLSCLLQREGGKAYQREREGRKAYQREREGKLNREGWREGELTRERDLRELLDSTLMLTLTSPREAATLASAFTVMRLIPEAT